MCRDGTLPKREPDSARSSGERTKKSGQERRCIEWNSTIGQGHRAEVSLGRCRVRESRRRGHDTPPLKVQALLRKGLAFDFLDAISWKNADDVADALDPALPGTDPDAVLVFSTTAQMKGIGRHPRLCGNDNDHPAEIDPRDLFVSAAGLPESIPLVVCANKFGRPRGLRLPRSSGGRILTAPNDDGLSQLVRLRGREGDGCNHQGKKENQHENVSRKRKEPPQ